MSGSGLRIITMRHARRFTVLLLAVATVLAGCASPTPATRPSTQGQPEAPAARVGPPKVLRLPALRDPQGGLIFGGGGNAAAQSRWMFHVSLTAYDAQANLQPMMAQKIPSIADGDWKVLPDGGMELTWKLRPNVKWHDGTPLTADDFVFGIQVIKDPTADFGSGSQSTVDMSGVSEVTAPDPQTLVVRWSRPYFDANVGSPPSVAPLPRHLLQDLYRAGDPAAFMNAPYWTTEFIGAGPFKLTDWTFGSHIEGQAFDDYFLGRPKIDRVIVRLIPDNQTIVASLMSGDLDMIAPSTLKMSDLQPVIARWGTDGGTIIPSMTQLVIARPQFSNPSAPWAQNVRVRQALLHLLDRQTMADELEGVPEAGPGDVFAGKSDPSYRIAEQRGFSRYPYDVNRAHQLLAEAGWTRGADGAVRNAAGQQFRIDVLVQSNTQVNVQYGLATQDNWRRGGLESELQQLTANAANPNEVKARATGVWLQPEELSPSSLSMFERSRIASAQNGWIGTNLNAYSNPEFDRRWGEYTGTLDPTQRQTVYADLLRWLSDEIAFFPLFYTVGSSIIAHRKGVRGPAGLTTFSRIGTWNIHTWELD
jgi:peptide/nickel transport system substrate-binding protein